MLWFKNSNVVFGVWEASVCHKQMEITWGSDVTPAGPAFGRTWSKKRWLRRLPRACCVVVHPKYWPGGQSVIVFFRQERVALHAPHLSLSESRHDFKPNNLCTTRIVSGSLSSQTKRLFAVCVTSVAHDVWDICGQINLVVLNGKRI